MCWFNSHIPVADPDGGDGGCIPHWHPQCTKTGHFGEGSRERAVPPPQNFFSILDLKMASLFNWPVLLGQQRLNPISLGKSLGFTRTGFLPAVCPTNSVEVHMKQFCNWLITAHFCGN